ncbi:helix-turn-helix domain-containing protein [Leifsonia sp. L25]|uniref:helix-turn-helix domain-containing protein n=1 Tax=Leifsonia TaxID=110932 RepID=UPI003D677A22
MSRSSAGGISSLSTDQLAEATGLPRSTVLRARLALVELGLEDVVPHPRATLATRRELHHG